MHGPDTRIIYDQRIGGIRVVKASIMEHMATFTCNEALGHCTVQVAAPGPMAPAIGYADGHFAMHYSRVSITPETIPAFETAYAAAKEFCENAGPAVDRIRKAVEDGRGLP